VKALPALDFNIARCHDRMEHTADAIAAYQRYLAEMPSSDPEAADVRARVAVLKQRLTDNAAAPQPVEAAAHAPPGPVPPVPVSATQAASLPTLVTPVAPNPVERPTQERSNEKPRRSKARTIAGAVLITAGVALAGAGAVLTGLGFSSSGDVSGTLDRYTSSIPTLNTERGAGLSLVAVGAAAMVVGAVVIALPAQHEQSVTMTVSPSLGGVTVAGLF
jgi:hypothetical protein